jgi:WD40 repeat protein
LVVGKYQGGRVIAAAMEDESIVQVWLPGRGEPNVVPSRSKVTSLGLADSVLAVGDIDGNVTLHDLTGYKLPRAINGVKSEVSVIAFDGPIKRIATGTADGTVRVFDFATGELQIEFQATPRRILSMQFSPAGDTLMTAGEDHATRIWPIDRDVSDLIQTATAVLPKASDRK